jgi:hypothetical protein
MMLLQVCMAGLAVRVRLFSFFFFSFFLRCERDCKAVRKKNQSAVVSETNNFEFQPSSNSLQKLSCCVLSVGTKRRTSPHTKKKNKTTLALRIYK